MPAIVIKISFKQTRFSKFTGSKIFGSEPVAEAGATPEKEFRAGAGQKNDGSTTLPVLY